MPLAELRDSLTALSAKAPCKFTPYIGGILATFSFAIFFGGSFADGFLAALMAVVIVALQGLLMPICPNNVIYSLMISFVTGSGICIMARMIPYLNIDKIMIGDIMLLIPGIAMTNSIRDMLVGDTIYGIMRLIESLLWAGALACGFMTAIWLIGG